MFEIKDLSGPPTVNPPQRRHFGRFFRKPYNQKSSILKGAMAQTNCTKLTISVPGRRTGTVTPPMIGIYTQKVPPTLKKCHTIYSIYYIIIYTVQSKNRTIVSDPTLKKCNLFGQGKSADYWGVFNTFLNFLTLFDFF